jgi:3-oxoadipate enol-lactonase
LVFSFSFSFSFSFLFLFFGFFEFLFLPFLPFLLFRCWNFKKMFDHGTGPPLIVVPGVQGRWEWMTPALRALQTRCRTVTYTLCGDIGSGMRLDPALGFDNYIRQLDSVFEQTGLERAAVCGVSYGGFIALRYAALRPGRVSRLILVSAPAPGWTPSERQRGYIERPWISAPKFVLTSPLRVWPEIQAAYDTWPERLMFTARHGARVVSAPMFPSLMAARVRLQQSIDFAPDCALVKAPTLIVTGEDGLDFVVPPDVTRRYLTMIPGSEYVKLERSGHIGMLTRSSQFAEIVSGFLGTERAERTESPVAQGFSPAPGSRGGCAASSCSPKGLRYED